MEDAPTIGLSFPVIFLSEKRSICLAEVSMALPAGLTNLRQAQTSAKSCEKDIHVHAS